MSLRETLRESIQVALLLAMGTLLHFIVPGYGSGMKPDLLLSMLFIVIMLKPRLQPVLLAGLLAGLLAAFTTTFPGGQLPNIIDKLVASIAVLGIVRLMQGRINHYLMSGLIGVLGTVISGIVFLASALFIVGLPAPFTVLLITVVGPAAVLNAVAISVLYPIVIFSKSTVERVSHKAA